MSGLLRGTFHALARPRALGYVYLWRLLSAWLVASPLARTLSAGTQHHPRGDAVLFEPGGLELSEAVRAVYPVLGSELRGSLVIGAVLAFLSLVPLCALLHALAERQRSGIAAWTARSIVDLPRFTLLGGATLLVRAVVGVAAVAAAAGLRRKLMFAPDPRTADALCLAIAIVAVSAMGVCGAVQDLARARIVAARATLLGALRHALGVLRSSPVSVLGGYLGALAAGVLIVAGAAWLTAKLDVSRTGSWRVIGVAAVHQAAIFLVITTRAGWLSHALALGELSAGPPAFDDKSADTAAQADPTPDPVA